MGCSIGVNGKYKVGYLKHRMMLTDATGDNEGMIWDIVELGHYEFRNRCRLLNRLT